MTKQQSTMANLTAKDLRIGNWILNVQGEPFQIQSQDFEYIESPEEVDGNPLEYNPIPLTPEILESAEFNDQFGGCYTFNGFVVDYSYTNKTFKIVGNNKTIYLEYLHELQNAYYLNEKKELTINLKQLQQA